VHVVIIAEDTGCSHVESAVDPPSVIIIHIGSEDGENMTKLYELDLA
jgi:hypothetical protein